MGFFNYHTHTTYCDGKSTPEEIVLEAIRFGMDTIGFSGHSPAFGELRDVDSVMYVNTLPRLPAYFLVLHQNLLREDYAGGMVFCFILALVLRVLRHFHGARLCG